MEGVPKFKKVGHLTPYRFFWPNLALFRLGSPVANLHAKFEFSSFNRSRDMDGVPKFIDWLTDWLTDWQTHKLIL